MLYCLMTVFMRTGRCDGQMGGLTELDVLLAAQTFVECQPKLLKHGNWPLLNISHRDNNNICKKKLYYFVWFRGRKIIAQTHTNPVLKTAEKAHLLLKWLFELKLSVDHLPT